MEALRPGMPSVQHVKFLRQELRIWEQKCADYGAQLDALLLRQQNGDPNVTDHAVDSMLGQIHHAAEQVRLKREHLERLQTPSE